MRKLIFSELGLYRTIATGITTSAPTQTLTTGIYEAAYCRVENFRVKIEDDIRV